MSIAYTSLETLKDTFAALDGVKTCKIGIEADISPADYPIIRIVPARYSLAGPTKQRTAEINLYFGWNTANSEGLESVYSDLLEMEEDIIATLKGLGGVYVETQTDEDRLPTYKLMFMRFDINIDRPVPT